MDMTGNPLLFQNAINGNTWSAVFSDGHNFYAMQQDGTIWFFEQLNASALSNVTKFSKIGTTEINNDST